MSELPDRINIDKKDRELYNKLDQEEILRYKGGRRTRKEQFLFAMAYGFKNKIRRPLETKEGFFLIKDLNPEDETLLNAVAIYETGSVKVLSNRAEVFKIAEEYAHAGIMLLCNKIESSSFGSFEKQLEKELFEIYNMIKLR
jgi:dnd system-associated protein 4